MKDDNIFYEKVEYKNIQCMDCFFRKEDIKIGDTVLEGAYNNYCSFYKNGKPKSVFSGEECQAYFKK